MKGKIAYLSLEAVREGGASYAHVHEIINGLQRRGWEVELFESNYTNKKTPNLLVKLWVFLYKQIQFLNKSKYFDAIYIRSHPAAFLAMVWCKIRGIPVIQEVNGPYDDLFIAHPWTAIFKTFFKTLIKSQLKLADAVIVVTHQLLNWVKKEAGQKKIYVIPNGANIELFHPNAQLHYSLPTPYVIFFGSLTRWQGIDTLLQAIKCTKWPKEMTLVIVGDGVEQPKVISEARDNQMIIYLSRIPFNEMAGVVASSIAGLIPKKGEWSTTGLSPLKMYETLACGVPVIVTDFPGQADLVRNHDCGLVIQPEDPVALAEAVDYLYHNPEERKKMGERGRQIIELEHSWDKRAEETERVITEVINKKSKK
jgi:glycosyltransferase involved in cell wall biosynthesis